MTGFRYVTMPMELSTYARHTSALAVMPSMHRVRRVFDARRSRDIDSNRHCAMTGSITLSCS